jgi:hypothetical protein
MKYLSLLLVLLLLIFNSCSKDDTIEVNNNAFTYLGSNYELDKAYFARYVGSDNYSLFIFSKEISFNTASFEMTGTGEVIQIDGEVKVVGEIPTGSLLINKTNSGLSNSGKVINALWGYIDFNQQNQSGAEIYCNSGTVNISFDSNIYEIVFNCTTDDGNDFVGYYRGQITAFDFN